MKTVGIIAEYNPFHNGHRYQIEEAKRLSGAERAVVVMSGSFVQRGEPACADKFTRAGWALDGGADMVLELPDLFALSCAERFASCGVRLLSGSGIVDAISFGSETGELETLYDMSFAEPDKQALDAALAGGASYPAALSEAQGGKLSPNDILAVEYIRAVRKYCPDMEIYPVRRSGSGYGDEELGGEFSSALAIRGVLSGCSGQTRLTPAVFDGLVRAMPRSVLDELSTLMKKGVFPATLDGLSDAVLYAFRSMGRDAVARLPEVSEGLENLFIKHSAESGDVLEMLAGVKSKRYTMARLKRISMNALLGAEAKLQDEAAAKADALYLRVLGIRGEQKGMLAELREKATLPVVVQSSDREALPKLADRVIRISELAHSIRALGQPYEKSVVADSSHRLIVRE